MEMTDSIQILKDRYLKNMKESPTLYIGIELEFPIVNCQGGATDTTVAKNLLKRLLDEHDFEAERFDRDKNPIQLKSTKNEDRILFEVSYNTLEFAFAKATRIQEIDERFKVYLDTIQTILGQEGHELQGKGIHPFWAENDNSPVKYPRY
ncbi:MAG: gamma-glutamylcysteine synthetase, partial [Streptococcus sp.]